MTDDLTSRISELEEAVLSLARAEFGDTPGHAFHGNQHTGGQGGGDSFGPNLVPGKPDLNSTNGVIDAQHMDRAQKLHNYERMHGTAATLKVMTAVERVAHGRGSSANATPARDSTFPT